VLFRISILDTPKSHTYLFAHSTNYDNEIREFLVWLVRILQGRKMMKSKGVAYLLHIFLGWLGAERFYVGDIGMGILNLLTAGGFGILWIIDLFLLSGRVDYTNAMFLARQGGNNINNVNSVQVNINPSMLETGQFEAAATVAPINQKNDVDLNKNK